MTVTTSSARALPVNPRTLAQRVGQRLRNHKRPDGPQPVLLISAAPTWPYDPILSVPEDRRVRVIPCISTLAIWEQLTGAPDLPTVLLTDLREDELGTGILSRVHGRRIVNMEPWSVIEELFGAKQTDPRLKDLPWAGRALVDATPSSGWPRLTGTVLQRDTALRFLAVERLQLAQLGVDVEDIDPSALLRWSTLPTAPQSLAALAEAERVGLLTWMTGEFGPPVRVLEALYAVGHLTDTLPLGLVCAALWKADDPDSLRAQGRVDQYLGGVHLDPDTITSFAQTATRTMVEVLSTGAGRDEDGGVARQLAHGVLDRAEELLLGFAATGAAQHSETLRSGFTHRLGTVAVALEKAVAAIDATSPAPARPSAATRPGGDRANHGRQLGLAIALMGANGAVKDLAAHHLAAHYRHRVERAEMALRLVHWLASTVDAPLGVAEGINRQVEQWAWVDLALGHVWIGEDAHTGLASAYRTIHDRARDRRRDLDRAFAEHLAGWTSSGTAPGELLTVETILPRVVAPLVHDGSRPVLLVVVDGMTAAVAADLAEELTGQGWLEYDPLGGAATRGPAPHRRGAVAALPTVTSVSRTSLLTGALRQGGQSEERAGFERNALWRGQPARLFHKGTMQGDAGEVLSEDLLGALSDPQTLVGVVVNTVDDALRYGRESADAGWQVSNLGPLRALLDYARYQGRAVILTSDHGHVLERDGSSRPAGDPLSARHRGDRATRHRRRDRADRPSRDRRGRTADRALEPRLRYLPRQAGYHGGASLAEVTVPLLALLPLGAGAPTGWRLLGPQQPSWWSTSRRPPRSSQPTPRNW